MTSFAKKHQILSLLSDGEFYSGQALGELLGVTRSAVGKHMQQLEHLGLDIYSVTGKGYKLASPLTLLDAEKILPESNSNGTKSANATASLEVHHVINSTNDHLLSQVRAGETLPNGYTVVAECQTAGRGRRGRQWVSPFGSHIYFSYLWHLDGIGQAMGLSVAVGLALRQTIAPLIDAPVTLKWPNDVYVDGKKIAGILVELEGQADGPCAVVIGIGINVNMPQAQGETIDQPWTDISRECDEANIDRNQLIGRLMLNLANQMQQFTQSGLAPIVASWNEHDHFYQKPVKLLMGNHQIEGIGQGIDAQGGIVLKDLKTQINKAYYGGEISVRGNQ